jgi:hypothetical protein
MSDTEPAQAAKIDFERAEPEEPAGEHVACSLCKRVITTEYWQYLGKTLCGSCREGVRVVSDEARRGATFGKALLFAGGVALACGIGYAVFVGLTHIQFALVTIGIGWAVGRAVQRVTRGFGTLRHQILAVVLTYFASTMGYVPSIIEGLRKTPSAEVSAPSSNDPQPAPAPEEKKPPNLAVALVVLTGVTTFIMLAAPFIELGSGFSGLIGLLIIFFGLRTAFRVSKGVEGSFTGPHRVAPVTP